MVFSIKIRSPVSASHKNAWRDFPPDLEDVFQRI